MRRFITASDVEILVLTGKRILYVDDEDVVTSVAREMAAKLGVSITEGPPPEEPVKEELANPLPSPIPQESQYSKSWIPSEFRGTSQREPVDIRAKDGIVLKNGTIVCPGQGTFKGDIYVSGGKVVSIHQAMPINNTEEIDVSGKYVLPGAIDPHVHLGIFSPFEQDARDETKAGVWGGVTTLGCFLYEKESYLPKLEQLFKKVNSYSSADMFFHLTLSTEKHLEEIPRYIHEFGIRSFKLYMCGVAGIIPDIDDGFMRKVYERLVSTGEKCTVCIHAENPSLVRWATEEMAAKDGMSTSVQEWSETHPQLAEEEAIRRASFLTKEFKSVSTYFVHVSTKGGIEALSKIKCDSDNIYAETTSPYLLFSIERAKGNIPKWLPPLRDRESQEALWEKLNQGKVDSLGTDSVPMSPNVKGLDKSIWEAMPNAPSLEHHLPGILTEGVVRRKIPVEQVIDLMTRRPAEIFGFFPRKGSLWPGADADIVVVDLDRWQQVGKEQIRSGASFSLFEDQVLTGWPVIVLKEGKLVVKDGQWISNPEPACVLNELKKK